MSERNFVGTVWTRYEIWYVIVDTGNIESKQRRDSVSNVMQCDVMVVIMMNVNDCE